MPQDLYFLTIAEASKLIKSKKLSPVDLTSAYIDRVIRLDNELHAFILLLEDAAMAEAKKAEAEIAAGKWKGPLHGIPIGLKDIYNTAGVATTGHSALFKDHVPPEDATTVRLLREAGAIIIGKLAHMNLPPAAHASICPGRRPAIPGISTGFQAVRRADRGQPLRPASVPARWARIPALNLFPRCHVRHCRVEADIRPRQPSRHPAPLVQSRPRRPHVLDGRGLRPDDAGAGGL